MKYGNIMKAVGAAVLAIGFAKPAHAFPYLFYRERTAVNYGDVISNMDFDLDFTTTSANGGNQFLTFTNPRSNTYVKYFPLTIFAAGCYEIQSAAGAQGADPIISVKNQSGTWNWLADDNAGYAQFRVRVYITSSDPAINSPEASGLAIAGYTYSNKNDVIDVWIKKIKANPGETVNGAQSCRQGGIPYWQSDLNSGNPYNPL
jgi:hypothetical protein